MKINPKYKDKIISLPASQVLDNLSEADEAKLKVLIITMSDLTSSLSDIANAAGITKEEVKSALAFWKEKDAISVTGLRASYSNNSVERTASHAPEKIQKSYLSMGLPTYNDEEIAAIMTRHPEYLSLVDECSRILETVMNTHETGIILMFREYLKLPDDYIMLLCNHCASIGKTSLHYVRSAAASLVERDITTYNELEEYYALVEKSSTLEGKVRRLFGLGGRSLSKKEKEYIEAWTKWAFSDEMIEKAYGITVDNTTRPSLKYMNVILENWYAAGITTAEAADHASEDYKKLYKTKTSTGKRCVIDDPGGGSFDAGDFFKAALERSYKDK